MSGLFQKFNDEVKDSSIINASQESKPKAPLMLRPQL